MPATAVHAFINSIDIHWSRLDSNKKHSPKDGISSRILKVLYDRNVRYDIIVSTMDNVLEFYRQNSTVKHELITSDVFQAMIFQLEAQMDANTSLKSIARVLKCCLELLKLDEGSESLHNLPLTGFLNAGLVSTVVRALRICNNDPSVMRIIGFLLRHLAENGVVIESTCCQDSFKFLEDVAIFLLRREGSVNTIFNYSRSIVLMRSARIKMESFVCSALHTTVGVIKNCECSRQSIESIRILSTLLMFQTWEGMGDTTSPPSHSEQLLTIEDYYYIFDLLVLRLAGDFKDAAIAVLICIAIRTALRPFVGSDSDTRFPSGLQRHLLQGSTLPDVLLVVIKHHQHNYRVIVAALECLFCLVSPYRACADPATYHIITPTRTRPAEVTREFDACELDDIEDERCAEVLNEWWPYVVHAIYNARWRRRKNFCLFLVCCSDKSCVHRDSALACGDEFPSLSLLYSSICPTAVKAKAVDKVFFSKKLCVLIMSYL